jgi:hypothetical protein
MSIVAVHGPQTFGSKAVTNSTKTFQAFAVSADGTKWRFVPTDQGQPAANYDWAWAHTSGTAGGSPASPVLNTMTPEFTFPAGPATKTITLTLNGIAQPTLVITIPAAGSTVSPMMLGEGDGEAEVQTEVQAEGEVTEEVPEVEVGYDPAAHTVAEVQEFVSQHPDELEAIYDAEYAGKARASLISWLENQLPFDPGAYTVQEVLDYAAENPGELEDIITAEQAGKNRVTLVSQLEALR